MLKKMALLIVASSFLFFLSVPNQTHNHDQPIQTLVQIGGF